MKEIKGKFLSNNLFKVKYTILLLIEDKKKY